MAAGHGGNGASNVELLLRLEASLPSVHDLPSVSVKRLLEKFSDEFYFWLLTEGTENIVDKSLISLLPAMPDEEIQINWTGRSGYETLHQAFLAFKLFKEIINKHYKDINLARGYWILDAAGAEL